MDGYELLGAGAEGVGGVGGPAFGGFFVEQEGKNRKILLSLFALGWLRSE